MGRSMGKAESEKLCDALLGESDRPAKAQAAVGIGPAHRVDHGRVEVQVRIER